MSEPEDRLLSHALRELLEDESPLDQSAHDFARRVRDAWETRDEAPAHELPRKVNGTARRSPRFAAKSAQGPKATRGWRRSVGAAAAVLLAAGAAWWFLRDGAPGPQPEGTDEQVAQGGQSTPDLNGLEPDAMTVAGVHTLHAGEALSLAPSGAQLVALDRARVAVDDTGEVQILAGRVELTADQDDLALDLVGDVQLLVDSQAALVVDLRRVDRLEPHDLGLSALGTLGIEVLRGDARLDGVELEPVELVQGIDPWLGVISKGSLRAALDYEREIPAQLRGMLASAWEPMQKRELIGREFANGIFAALRDEPALWGITEGAMAERVGLVGEGDPLWMRRMWVTALAVDSSPVALRLARRAWRIAPGAFSGESITALAERGAFEFEREVAQWFEHMSVEDAEPEAIADAAPIAALLAMNGDARGIEVLRRELDGIDGWKSTRSESFAELRYLRAAAALSRLGDPGPLDDTLTKYIDEARDVLDGDDRESAARTIDLLAYGLALRDGGSIEPDPGPDAPDWVLGARVGDIFAHMAGYRRYRGRQREAGEAESLEEELARLSQR